MHSFSKCRFALRIYDDFGIHWYGLSFVLGFVAAYLFIRWLANRQRQGFPQELILDYIIYSAVGAIFGARLGYVFFYDPHLFLQTKSEFPYWGIFAMGDGGMSAHGGILGVTLASILFAFKNGLNRLYIFDLAAVASTFGIFLGRIANFFNGEFIGRAVQDPHFEWGFKFPQEIYTWPMHSPQRLAELKTVIEKIPELGHEDWSSLLEKFQQQGTAALEPISKILFAINQAIQSGNSPAKMAIAPMLELRHPVQLYSALAEGLFLFLFLFLLWYRPRKPGVISALFLVLYSIISIVIEHYRMPDPILGLQIFELTRAQILSGLMLLVGLLLLFLWGRRETLPASGWGRGQNVKIHRR
jgi:phosphatidylglycerol:prolipoprotein diacylglycerol transferase